MPDDSLKLAAGVGPSEKEALYGAMATTAFPPLGPYILLKWMFFGKDSAAEELTKKAMQDPNAKPEEKNKSWWDRVMDKAEDAFGGVITLLKWIVIGIIIYLVIKYILPRILRK